MSSNGVALTICIPTYNRAGYVEQCLGKLLGWAPEEWEILVGDNASTDSTLEMLRHTFEDIRIVTRPRNIGAEANLFDLYKQAKGTYVTYLADDDELEAEAFLEAFEALKANPSAPALYAPWACVDKVAGTSKQFYTMPSLTPRSALMVFKMICHEGVLPEIGIFKREAAIKAFQLSPFAYWAFAAYGNFRKEGTPILHPTPFYRNILRHYEGESRQTLGMSQCITHLGEYRGGLEYLLGVCLEEEGKQHDMEAIRAGQLQIAAFMAGRVEVAARISQDPVLEQRLVSFGGRR